MAKRKEGPKTAEESGGSELNRFYIILGVVAILGIGIVGYALGSGMLSRAAMEPVGFQGAENDEELFDLAQGVVLGDPEAPVTIVEFGDYQCPTCGIFTLQVKPLLELNYVREGKASFVFYDFPLTGRHPNAFIAARAARCAGDQEKYWEYHKQLFSSQSVWAPETSPLGTFGDFAERVGLDKGVFSGCLRSDRHAETVSAGLELARRLQLPGTPAIVVRGQGESVLLPRFDYETIRQAVDEALRKMGEGGEASTTPDQ